MEKIQVSGGIQNYSLLNWEHALTLRYNVGQQVRILKDLPPTQLNESWISITQFHTIVVHEVTIR